MQLYFTLKSHHVLWIGIMKILRKKRDSLECFANSNILNLNLELINGLHKWVILCVHFIKLMHMHIYELIIAKCSATRTYAFSINFTQGSLLLNLKKEKRTLCILYEWKLFFNMLKSVFLMFKIWICVNGHASWTQLNCWTIFNFKYSNFCSTEHFWVILFKRKCFSILSSYCICCNFNRVLLSSWKVHIWICGYSRSRLSSKNECVQHINAERSWLS